jgi:hypothetical protein
MRRLDGRAFIVRFVYAIVLFTGTVSTLEGLGQLNDDLLRLPGRWFHLVVVFIGLVLACVEGYSMRGLDGLKAYFGRDDPVAEPPPRGRYRYRGADSGDIEKIHALALSLYGGRYKFSEDDLRRWWKANPCCFFLMLCGTEVVGYIDAFPISDQDYRLLLREGDEKTITPETPHSAGVESSFYIASVVVEPSHRAKVRSFINKAFSFYRASYPSQPWRRICAIAYTPNGEKWIKQKGMCEVGQADMWYIDRDMLTTLSPENGMFWRRLLPEEAAT